MSSGVEPGAVAGGEFVVGSSSEFEFTDACGPDPEVVGGGREGQVLGSAGGSEVAVVGDGAVSGQCLEDLEGDGALRHPAAGGARIPRAGIGGPYAVGNDPLAGPVCEERAAEAGGELRRFSFVIPGSSCGRPGMTKADCCEA